MEAVADGRLPFGLSETIRGSRSDVFAQFPKVDSVLVYGSRATGRNKPQSDIDLAVLAPTMLEREFSSLWMALDDLPILFRLDVSLWHKVTNPVLKKAMLDDGIPLYQARVSGPKNGRHRDGHS